MGILRKILFTLSVVFFFVTGSYGNPPQDIEAKIKEGDLPGARELLEKQIAYFRIHSADSLVVYIPLAGLIYLEENPDLAAKKVEELTRFILAADGHPSYKAQALSSLARFYSDISKEKKAYDTYIKEKEWVMKAMPDDYNLLAKLENNLAVTAYRINEIPLSKTHSREAERLIQKADKPDPEVLYSIRNSKASVFYFSYQLDSAEAYYQRALSDLADTEKSLLEKRYSEALIHNNLAGIYSIREEKELGIAAMKKAIEAFTYYNAHAEDAARAIRGKEFLYESIDNLAGIYRSLGDYHKGLNLLNYSYERKQNELPPGSNAVFKSEILLGQALIDLGRLHTAENYLTNGVKKIPADDPGYLFWKADGYAALALIADKHKDDQKASRFYALADSVYQIALGGQSDDIYLEFLNKKALFYAGTGRKEEAVNTSRKSLDYIMRQDGGHSPMAAKGHINLAKIFLLSDDFEKTEKHSLAALEVLDGALKRSSGKLLDSIGIEMEKPEALLLYQKAKYALKSDISPKEIDILIAELSQVQDILQRRISVLHAEEGWRAAMEVQGRILSFINQLNLKKYDLLRDEKVIDDMIQTHERSVYKRIRNNINRQRFIRFSDVPEEILTEEAALKDQLAQQLKGDDGDVNDFIRTEKMWMEFQEKLKKDFPDYYRARYSTDDTWKESEIWKNMPSDVTIVRYFFMDESLYALVLQKEGKAWVPLGELDLEKEIAMLSDFKTYESNFCKSAFAVYQKIWAPLKNKIAHERVMIIPDRNLYHLSFELLPEKEPKNFSELTAHALLKKHAFSYHYSLMALQSNIKEKRLQKNFIAFTPAFSEKEKQPFRPASDTLITAEEEEYLKLLPLPFSVTLAQKAGKTFGGISYTGIASTKDKFIRFSSGHSIIHLGTHAIANDEYPEYSKLIFAKDPAHPEEDNILYLYDLYKYDLRSDITVLTACETGKSGSFPGEGMISLAHAFMFAGSESILTGLWEIDEQMTARIVEYFYFFLNQGVPKDQALQQAKLKYLSESDGRLIHPQYWAGLALMGDVTPIAPLSAQTIWKVLGSVALLLFGILVVVLMIRKRKEHKYPFND